LLTMSGMCLVGMFLFPALAICSLAKRSRRRGFYKLAVSGVVCLVARMAILGVWGMLAVAEGWMYSQSGITEALLAVDNVVTSMAFVCAALGLVELIACCWVLDRVLKGQQ